MAPVTVVGAGIAGLAVANFLARAGFPVTVIERAPGPTAEGAGIQISPNAAHVLAALGILDAVRARAVAPEAIELLDGDQLLSRFELGTEIARRTRAPYLVVARATLRDCLLDALPANVSLRYGEAFTPRAGPVIGADGVNSAVRNAFARSARETGWTAWRRLAERSDEPVTRVRLAANEHRVAYPLPDATNEVWIRRTGEPKPGPDWRPWHVLAVRPDTPWTNGVTVLIGDAAHAMPPYAAQGGAMALEDAATLAAFMIEHEPARAFARYEQERRPRIDAVRTLTESNRRIYHMSGPLRLARNFAMRLAPQAALQRRMAWIYDWKPPEAVRSTTTPSR